MTADVAPRVRLSTPKPGPSRAAPQVHHRLAVQGARQRRALVQSLFEVRAKLFLQRRIDEVVAVLDGPASSASHDVEVVITEKGTADLRGLDRSGRRRAIAGLWPWRSHCVEQ